MKRFKDCCLKAQARIWPCLVCATTDPRMAREGEYLGTVRADITLGRLLLGRLHLRGGRGRRGCRRLSPGSHHPLERDQIVFFSCLDLYHKSPDSGVRQYEEMKRRIDPTLRAGGHQRVVSTCMKTGKSSFLCTPSFSISRSLSLSLSLFLFIFLFFSLTLSLSL